MDPVGCSIGELRAVDQKYKGENKWPFILNNLHRYFFYAAFILMLFHWLSFTHAIWVDGSFRIGVGVVILFLDSLFLSLYVLSCHSCKHIVGGGLNSASWAPGLEGWLAGKSTFTGSLAQPIMKKVINIIKKGPDVLNSNFFIGKNLIYSG